MTSEERMEFVSERLMYFIPNIARITLEASGAVSEVARQIVDCWEEDLQSANGKE